jgi:transcriptional regulator with XRE-family HTH domain
LSSNQFASFLLPRTPRETEELALLGQTIRELREQRGLKQGELADTVGVAERRVQALEDGRLDPDYVLLVRVAKALHVRPGSLVSRAEELANANRAATEE